MTLAKPASPIAIPTSISLHSSPIRANFRPLHSATSCNLVVRNTSLDVDLLGLPALELLALGDLHDEHCEHAMAMVQLNLRMQH